jgi:ligand-binding sensor domain-containing protein
VQFTAREGFLGTLIRKVFEDSRGAIWVGTMEKGAIQLEFSEISSEISATYYSPREGLTDMFVNDILEDEHGQIWFAMGLGVTRFTVPQDGIPGQFLHFTESTGLVNHYTRSIRADGAGNIWVSTSSGLSKIRTGDSRVFSFHKAEGLMGSEFLEAHVSTVETGCGGALTKVLK